MTIGMVGGLIYGEIHDKAHFKFILAYGSFSMGCLLVFSSLISFIYACNHSYKFAIVNIFTLFVVIVVFMAMIVIGLNTKFNEARDSIEGTEFITDLN